LDDVKHSAGFDISRLVMRFAHKIRPLARDGVDSSVPVGSAQYLVRNNDRLKQLKKRYAGHPAGRHSLWSESYLKREIKLTHFRADNAYVYQKRYANDATYALTTQYVLAHDSFGLLTRLPEDELFGNNVIDFDGKLLVSRDLLDSVLEISFLQRELNFASSPQWSMLDIGAGYGRFAHRVVAAIPNLDRIFCTDAIAESTFISEYYLKFRGVDGKAMVVPLDEVEDTLSNTRVDLAVNIHSFGECTLTSISWWLDLLRANKTRFLFIVANGEGLGSTETDKTNIDYLPVILESGYRLKTKEAKYCDSPSVQRHGLYPTNYFLFERQ